MPKKILPFVQRLLTEYAELSERRVNLYAQIESCHKESNDLPLWKRQYTAMVNYEECLYERLHYLQATEFLGASVDVKPVRLPLEKIAKHVIDKLADSIEYSFAIVDEKKTTCCTAKLPNGFVLGHGFAYCLNPNDFVKADGEKFSKLNASVAAIGKLWELEGYARAMGYTA